MCTRFYADIDKELKPIITAAQQVSFAQQMMISLSRPLSMSGEIRPTDIAAVIAPDKNGRRTVFPMQWGFHVQGLKQPVVNARIETAAEKPTFRDSWYRRRCIIPPHRGISSGSTHCSRTAGKRPATSMRYSREMLR